jgi:hypothetical protein
MQSGFKELAASGGGGSDLDFHLVTQLHEFVHLCDDAAARGVGGKEDGSQAVSLKVKRSEASKAELVGSV